MASEKVTVRMSRSTSTIPWGLILRMSGSDILVNTVEKDSLAEKACILPNDKLVEVAGYKSPVLTLSKANGILLEPSTEINFVFNRYITAHPSLPWNLSEQENKIVVDQVSAPSYSQPQHTCVSGSTSERQDISTLAKSSLPRPVALGFGPAPFKSPTRTDLYKEEIFRKREGFQNEYNTSSFTKKEIHNDYKPASAQDQSKEKNMHFSSAVQTQFPVQTADPKVLNQSTFLSSAPVQNNVSKAYTASFPSGNRVFSPTVCQQQHQQRGPRTPYQHSGRTIRELSPTASIRYLHANPINASYAYETPAEEYLRKTGGLFGTDPNVSKMSRLPYLTSETRRLIAEEEKGGFDRAVSPAQSGSFKRISKAVGTPLS